MRKHVYGGVAVAGLAAMLIAATVAVAATFAPAGMTSNVVPKHVYKPPFTYTDKGHMKLPKVVCAPGITNKSYCSKPPKGACSGTVQITVTLRANPYLDPSGGELIKVYTTPLKKNCHYKGKTTLDASKFTTNQFVYYGKKKNGYVGVNFSAKFLGNSFMSGITAKTQTVIAKVQSTVDPSNNNGSGKKP